MKAVYLEKPGKIVGREVDMPSPGERDVLVKIKSVGVCGSDIEYYKTGRIGEFVVEKPLILGHEAAGVVSEAGKKVEDLEEGDRVALEPGIPCRRCRYCKTGRYNLCPDVDFMATPPNDGAFVEYVAHPADFAYKLPQSISFDEGALIEPLSVGIHITNRARMEYGDKVAILGAGTIGLMSLLCALDTGASKVVVTDVIDFRLEKAKDLGATRTINVREEKVDDLKSSFDKVIQAAGAKEAYRQAIDLARRGGRIVQVGHPEAESLPIDPNILITKELDMVGSFRYRGTYPKAIPMLNSGRVDLEPLISERFTLEEVEEALNCPKENPDSCIKPMVSISD